MTKPSVVWACSGVACVARLLAGRLHIAGDRRVGLGFDLSPVGERFEESADALLGEVETA
jgi:hypothetical protein